MAQKIVIASGKGGVGKSTVSAGLCCALKAREKNVLAIDFDIGLRSLDLLFGLSESVVNTWGDIVLGNCEAERAVLTAANGVDVIASPLYMNDNFNEDSVADAVRKFDGMYDYIIIDAPAGISKGFSLACSAADRGIVVATPDEVCTRSVGIAADVMNDNGVEDVRLIINKFVKKFSIKRKFLNIDDIIDNTSVQLIGVVPYDSEIGFSAMEKVGIDRKFSSKKSFDRIARRITGEDIPLKIK